MRAVVGVPLERIELGAEIAIVVQCVEDPARPGHCLLDVRLHRRAGQDGGRVAEPTAAGFHVPLSDAERLSRAIVKIATRGAQAALWGAGRQ
jgi:hypothetical protein